MILRVERRLSRFYLKEKRNRENVSDKASARRKCVESSLNCFSLKKKIFFLSAVSSVSALHLEESKALSSFLQQEYCRSFLPLSLSLSVFLPTLLSTSFFCQWKLVITLREQSSFVSPSNNARVERRFFIVLVGSGHRHGLLELIIMMKTVQWDWKRKVVFSSLSFVAREGVAFTSILLKPLKIFVISSSIQRSDGTNRSIIKTVLRLDFIDESHSSLIPFVDYRKDGQCKSRQKGRSSWEW